MSSQLIERALGILVEVISHPSLIKFKHLIDLVDIFNS